MTTWRWIDRETVLAVHEEQLSEHGGLVGVRDSGGLDAALARPLNKAAYDHEIDVYTLAAAYAFGLTKAHAFSDGNKRTAAVVMELFLELNGFVLNATDTELLPIHLALAAGEIDEAALSDWLEANCTAMS
jgi:death-on-curing protein